MEFEAYRDLDANSYIVRRPIDDVEVHITAEYLQTLPIESFRAMMDMTSKQIIEFVAQWLESIEKNTGKKLAPGSRLVLGQE